MNDDSLNQLFAKAREAGPRDTSREEFGFETRLRARLAHSGNPAYAAFAVWPWRLLPFFALLAISIAWNVWQTEADSELAIRSGLEQGSVEWAYVEGITGRTL